MRDPDNHQAARRRWWRRLVPLAAVLLANVDDGPDDLGRAVPTAGTPAPVNLDCRSLDLARRRGRILAANGSPLIGSSGTDAKGEDNAQIGQ